MAGCSLLEVMAIPESMRYTQQFKVKDLMVDGAWNLPQQMIENYPDVVQRIHEIDIADELRDRIIWTGSANGRLTMKQAYEAYRDKGINVQWETKLWRTFIPPKISMLSWKIIRKKIATAERLRRRGAPTGRVCLRCVNGEIEDENHIFVHCQLARNLWNWVSQVIHYDITQFTDAKQLICWAVKRPEKLQVHQVITTLVLAGLWELWCARNSLVFDAKLVSNEQCVSNVRNWVRKTAFMMTGVAENNINEMEMLRFFGVCP